MLQMKTAILALLLSVPAVGAEIDTWQKPQEILLPSMTNRWRGGYMVGNGRMYGVAAVGSSLKREWKSSLEDPASLSQVAWVVGPSYGNANLGYGWEIIPEIDRHPSKWEKEEILKPSPEMPFWGSTAETGQLRMQLREILHPRETIWLRQVIVSASDKGAVGTVSLRIPVYADPRNAPKDDPAWSPKEREGHVAPEAMLRVEASTQTIVLQGARRRLYSEYSSQPMCQQMDYPSRFLATSLTVEGDEPAVVRVDERGFVVELGELTNHQSRVINLWLATADDAGKASGLLWAWKGRPSARFIAESKRPLPPPLFTRTDGKPDRLLEMIRGCQNLCDAAQAKCGGTLANPYMYPMYYVRDQYGSFKLYLALQEYDRAWRVLAYHLGMENQWGFQNSYEAVPDPPDPFGWTKTHPEQPGQGHGGAEVPSYLILMARDYYLATGDLQRVKPLYARLAYNLRAHNFDPKTHLLPSPGDESYTQIVSIGGEDFTDSNVLFLGAADFMVRLAKLLGQGQDAGEFQEVRDRTFAAMMKRLWKPDNKYFPVSGRDERPAFDPSLRWFHLDIGQSNDEIHTGCLNAVLGCLINPIRVVPDRWEAAGMEPGYLVQALSRSQHPGMHQAARLLTRYASDTDNVSEYYYHGTEPTGGKLRPWESGVAGWALVQYLLGLQIDLPTSIIRLQPHLPTEWPGWISRSIPLADNQGALGCRLEKSDNHEIRFTLTREGGKDPLRAEIEFGGFEARLLPQTLELHPDTTGRVLRCSIMISPGTSSEPWRKTFSFRE